jgi:hypothetical protein
METQSSKVQVKAKTRVHEDTRRSRRHLTGAHSLARPFARFRSGNRTGTTPHFALWQADVKLKSALQRTRLTSLADRHNDPALAKAYGLLSKGGFKTVFDLTQADAGKILAVKGIGPKRLAELKADLAKHQVAVNW